MKALRFALVVGVVLALTFVSSVSAATDSKSVREATATLTAPDSALVGETLEVTASGSLSESVPYYDYRFFVDGRNVDWSPFINQSTFTKSWQFSYASPGEHIYTLVFWDFSSSAAEGGYYPVVVSATVSVVANTPGKLTGGGTIGRGRDGRAFSFDAEYAEGQPGPEGILQFDDRGAGFSFESTSLTLFTVEGNQVTIRGMGRVDGIDGYSYIMVASDMGEPGRGLDTFSLSIPSLGDYQAEGFLTGGNIQLHRP